MDLGGKSEIEVEQANEELGISGSEKPAKTEEEVEEENSITSSVTPASKSTESLSFVRVTMESKTAAEKLLKKLFKSQLIADAQVLENNERIFMKNKKQINEDSQVKVRMVTTSTQVPFLVSYLSKNIQNKDTEMGNDLVATKVFGGSQVYINWVRE